VARARLPIILPDTGPPDFPDPNFSDARGLIAAGGSLTPEWLLSAYDRGIFPWYDEDMPPLWWSPDPRAVVDRESLRVSHSMRRFARNAGLRLTFDTAFVEVMRGCAENRQDGTWILPDMLRAYARLHEMGHAHSVEVWNQTQLVGGLYGVQRGSLFAAESMFHRQTNASKLALIAAVRALFAAGITLFDVQFLTPHLSSLGCYCIARRDYLTRVAHALGTEVRLDALKGAWPSPL
jgi:leucyl/phenylalanyl-tRNA---protein transferase